MTRSTFRVALLTALLVAASPPLAAAAPPAVSFSPQSVNTVRQKTPSVPVVRFEIRFDLSQNEVTMLSKPGYAISKRTQAWVQDGLFRESIRDTVLRATLTRDSLGCAILANLHDHLGSTWIRAYARASRPSPARYRLVLAALNDIARNRGSTA